MLYEILLQNNSENNIFFQCFQICGPLMHEFPLNSCDCEGVWELVNLTNH